MWRHLRLLLLLAVRGLTRITCECHSYSLVVVRAPNNPRILGAGRHNMHCFDDDEILRTVVAKRNRDYC